MEANYLAIAVNAVLSIVLGTIWYGPLFGKTWMKVIGIDPKDKTAQDKMKKDAGPLYGIQLLLTVIQLYFLSVLIQAKPEVSAVQHAFTIWLGFVMPTTAGTVLWTGKKTELKKDHFMVQSGFNFVMFIVFGLVFSYL